MTSNNPASASSLDLSDAVEDYEDTRLSTVTASTNQRSTRFNTSLATLSTKPDGDEEHVVAVIDSRGPTGQVGLAALSAISHECIVLEISDTARFTRTLRFLAVHRPCLILLAEDAVNSRLPVVLGDVFAKTQGIPRSWFSERAGRRVIDTMSLKEKVASLLVEMDRRYYALAALGALMQWVEEGGDIIRPGTLPVSYSKGEEGVMIIDYHSGKNLEIVRPLEEKSNSSLFQAVRRTVTKMGDRMLRSNLLQPPSGTL